MTTVDSCTAESRVSILSLEQSQRVKLLFSTYAHSAHWALSSSLSSQTRLSQKVRIYHFTPTPHHTTPPQTYHPSLPIPHSHTEAIQAGWIVGPSVSTDKPRTPAVWALLQLPNICQARQPCLLSAAWHYSWSSLFLRPLVTVFPGPPIPAHIADM